MKEQVSAINKLASTISEYGVDIVMVAFLMVIVLGFVVWLMKQVTDMIKNTQQANAKYIKDSLESIRESSKENFDKIIKEQQEQAKKSRDSNKEALKNLSQSINTIYSEQSKELDDIQCKIEEINDTIESKKKWDLQSYQIQIKQVLKLSIIDIKDYVEVKIEQNSLYENYDIIMEEIRARLDKIIDNGRKQIRSIPYKSEFDNKLFKKTDMLKRTALKKISIILKVDKQHYDYLKLKRQVKLLADEMVNMTEKSIEETIREVEK